MTALTTRSPPKMEPNAQKKKKRRSDEVLSLFKCKWTQKEKSGSLIGNTECPNRNHCSHTEIPLPKWSKSVLPNAQERSREKKRRSDEVLSLFKCKWTQKEKSPLPDADGCRQCLKRGHGGCGQSACIVLNTVSCLCDISEVL